MRTVINAIFSDEKWDILVVDKPSIWKTILPWWKQEPWESDEETLKRECREELWVDVEVWEYLWEITWKSPTSQIETLVKFYAAKICWVPQTKAEVEKPRYLAAEKIILYEKTSDLTRAVIQEILVLLNEKNE